MRCWCGAILRCHALLQGAILAKLLIPLPLQQMWGCGGNTLHGECRADMGIAGKGWFVPPVSRPRALEGRAAGALRRVGEGVEGMSG